MRTFIKTMVVCIWFVSGMSHAFAEEVVIIVNKEGPLVSISETEIRMIYMGEKRFARDIKIIPIDLKNDIANIFLSSSMINMTPKDYRTHWLKKIFQDGLQPPVLKSTMEGVIKSVKNEKGAIGYVARDALKKNDNEIVIIKTIK